MLFLRRDKIWLKTWFLKKIVRIIPAIGIVSNLIEFTVFTIGHLFWKQLKFLHKAKHFLNDGFITIRGEGSNKKHGIRTNGRTLHHINKAIQQISQSILILPVCRCPLTIITSFFTEGFSFGCCCCCLNSSAS